MAASGSAARLTQIDRMLDRLDAALVAAGHEDEKDDYESLHDKAKDAAEESSVAAIKEAIGGLSDNGRKRLKSAVMGDLMETDGNTKAGARKDAAKDEDDDDESKDAAKDEDDNDDDESKDAADDDDSDDPIDDELAGLDLPKPKKGKGKTSALKAAVAEMHALRAAVVRQQVRPVVDRMVAARIAAGMPAAEVKVFRRQMLKASVPELKRRYKEDRALMASAPGSTVEITEPRFAGGPAPPSPVVPVAKPVRPVAPFGSAGAGGVGNPAAALQAAFVGQDANASIDAAISQLVDYTGDDPDGDDDEVGMSMNAGVAAQFMAQMMQAMMGGAPGGGVGQMPMLGGGGQQSPEALVDA